MKNPDSYYSKNTEARKAYQKRYYGKNRFQINRKRLIDAELEPEKYEAYISYQRDYYLRNREQLLATRRQKRRDRASGIRHLEGGGQAPEASIPRPEVVDQKPEAEDGGSGI
jgi:hypothetical protein